MRILSLIIAIALLAGSFGCTSQEPAAVKSISVTELPSQKSDEAAALVSEIDLPQRFLVRFDNIKHGAQLDIFAIPAEYKDGVHFKEELPLICSVAMKQGSVSLKKGDASVNTEGSLSPKVTRGFVKWYLTRTVRYSYTEVVSWLTWDDHIWFLVSSVPLTPDADMSVDFTTDGAFLGESPGVR